MEYNTSKEIKTKLKYGDYELISEMTKGQYKPGTVAEQVNGRRTLKAPVIEAANKLIQMRESLVNNK